MTLSLLLTFAAATLATAQTVAAVEPTSRKTGFPIHQALVLAINDCSILASGRISMAMQGISMSGEVVERTVPERIREALHVSAGELPSLRYPAREGDVWQVYEPEAGRCSVIALAGDTEIIRQEFIRTTNRGDAWKPVTGRAVDQNIYEWDIPAAAGPAALLRMTARFGEMESAPAIITIQNSKARN